MKALAGIAVAVSWVALAGPVLADSRVDAIRQTGTITLGHPETSVPFAYLDGNQKPVGYTVEICEKIAGEIKSALNLPKLDIRYNPTTSATRIPLLANGTIDLECGNTTNNVERHKLVAFAPTTFVAQVVLMARKDGGVDVNNPASFRGKTIAAQAGGQTFKVISQINAKGNYGITVAGAKDTGEAFLMVETGRAAGTANDDGLAYGQVASSKTPDAFIIGTKSLEIAPYGIMEPKDDPEFKKLVDDAVLKLIKDGTVAALYDKYFNAPIPPRGINLKYPMSDALKRALAKPTDSGDPADYQ
ncbi:MULTISPECIES: amino acid ABC transporter substrate-binding protein [Azorhizobium]|nr:MULTISPECIES: amino acid ABC transporter substrate-binding protein [Azorhizobium]TDT99113.1 amino acid ABC transporter substrate-binding protein (PAAT family) [Azorhizobium sp. AG788]